MKDTFDEDLWAGCCLEETQIFILESRLPFLCIAGGHVTNLASVVIKREREESSSRQTYNTETFPSPSAWPSQNKGEIEKARI